MRGIMKIFAKSFHSYRMERVEAETTKCVLVGCNPAEPSHFYGAALNSTLAHIQGALTSEDVWPGDVVMAFYPETFAVRWIGYPVYVLHGPFWAHIREELLRLGQQCVTADQLWRNRFGLTTTDRSPTRSGGDGCDDDLDTLNSELLLDREYIGPEKLNRSGPFKGNTPTLSPQRRVVAIRPIEQED